MAKETSYMCDYCGAMGKKLDEGMPRGWIEIRYRPEPERVGDHFPEERTHQFHGWSCLVLWELKVMHTRQLILTSIDQERKKEKKDD